MKPGSVRTFTGQYVDVTRPDPNTICVEDIAHQLANENRWGGATSRPYSVAEHSIWVARYAKRLAPASWSNLAVVYALLHDAHEAYMKDLPTPIKALFPDFAEYASRVDRAIWQRFNILPISHDLRDVIEMADQYAAWCEATVLVSPCRYAKAGLEPPASLEDTVGMARGIASYDPGWKRAKDHWMRDFNFYIGQVP